MAEITQTDREAVTSRLEKDFGVPTNYAKDYAMIAEFLSVESLWQPALQRLSDTLESHYWTFMLSEHNGRGSAGSNLMTRAIALEAVNQGFQPHVGIVYAGFVDPGKFIDYVKNCAFWKDAVSSNHGEHSHSFQWLMIAREVKTTEKIRTLYAHSVVYKSKGNYYHTGHGNNEQIYLWDFLCDCFNHGVSDPDYTKHMVTNTCRSPTFLNKHLFQQDYWLSQYLKGRYEARKWNDPSQEFPTSIKEYAKEKHASKKNFTDQGGNVFQRDLKAPLAAHSKPDWAPFGEPLGGEKQGVVEKTKIGWGEGNVTLKVKYQGSGNNTILFKIATGENTEGLESKAVKFKVKKVGNDYQAYAISSV
ncbi:MAG: hypothetical protein BVN35_20395 [Proteobacteria bacterium ST_bin11]|jgi:hypothetical protein|nr:MAG: hypothetical protein BVN35_20395 [Proteobacteria bacterium ST_bin11]